MVDRRGRFLLGAIAVSLALHLAGELQGTPWQIYLFKPLTTALVGVLAWSTSSGARSTYRVAVLAGLACSLAGDVFLMLPADRFIEGLASFLLAHLCYLVAFTRDGGPGFHLRRVLPWVVWFAALLAGLAPRLGPLLGPVAVYGIALGSMAWQAWERAGRRPEAAARFAAWGAVLFVASDSALAVNRFLTPVPGERLLVMTTYVAAQVLIALSVPRAGSRPESGAQAPGAVPGRPR